ncbi:DUF6090 family protein [Algibacter sp. AS12]|uniref:DUF6090 family protein n=1 Tax=Algibacter sp. AS12 TaxID=3135773 RepID=UPI00398B6A92
MIKIFRKIRQNLLIKSKTGKYFKYAIGEIILVVIGILIALQINNWNENRLTNKAVKTYLNNLIQDLQTDQIKLNSMYKWHSFKHYSMQYLIDMEGTNSYDPVADDKNDIPQFQPNHIWNAEIPKIHNKEFIQLTYKCSHKDGIYPPNKYTLDELKSTGMYSNINPKLKNEIGRYGFIWENDFNGNVEKLALDWQASIAEDGFITTDIYKLTDPISILKNNTKRIGLMKRMIRESGWVVLSTIKLKTMNKELIQLLEKEITSL